MTNAQLIALMKTCGLNGNTLEELWHNVICRLTDLAIAENFAASYPTTTTTTTTSTTTD